MTALHLLGIESTSFSNSAEVITRNHELMIASIRLVLLHGRFCITSIFSRDHKFSVGLRSGLFPGQISSWTLCCWNHLVQTRSSRRHVRLLTDISEGEHAHAHQKHSKLQATTVLGKVVDIIVERTVPVNIEKSKSIKAIIRHGWVQIVIDIFQCAEGSFTGGCGNRQCCVDLQQYGDAWECSQLLGDLQSTEDVSGTSVGILSCPVMLLSKV